MSDRGLLDTSVFIAAETGRPLDQERLPPQLAISVVTLAELEAGVLAAKGTDVRARRLATAQRAASFSPLPVDPPAAAAWARLRVRLAEERLRMGVNDLWIASIAASRGLPVVTQDQGFDVLVDLSLVDVIKV